MRITQKDLEAVCARINAVTGSPVKPYIDGVAQRGNFHLSYAYSGVALHRMANFGGGVHAIIDGYRPKKELYEQMHVFLSGLSFQSHSN